MAILNFPNTRDNGDPLEIGDTYTGDNGVVYTYDGAKWSGRNISTIPTSNAIVNAGYVVQVDTGGNLFTPSYIFPNLPGQEGQVLTWPASGTILEWTDQSGTGGSVSISDFGEGFSLTAANKIVTNKLYSTNQTQLTQHYRLELDTNGVIILPDQSIINGSTLRGVYGTGDANYTGITIGPDSNHREESWVWVDHTGVSIATEYSTSAYTWKFDNNGNLTLPSFLQGTTSTIIGDSIALTTAPGATWLFQAGGTLSLPGDIVVGDGGGHIYIDNGIDGASSIRWLNADQWTTMFRVYLDGKDVQYNEQLEVGYRDGMYITTTGDPTGIGDEVLDHTWTFGTDTTLTIPGDIQDANGSVIRIATTSTAPTRVEGQLWFNTIDGRGYIRYDNTWMDLSPTEVPAPSTYLDGLTIDGTTISTVDTTASIYVSGDLVVDGNIISNNTLSLDRLTTGTASLILTENGTLTAPGNITMLPGGRFITDGSTGYTGAKWINFPNVSNQGIIRVYSDEGANDRAAITLSNLVDISIETTDAMLGRGTGGNDHKWTFGGNGRTTFPGNFIVTPNSSSPILTADTDLTIQTDGINGPTWTFFTNGNLTFPDTSVQTEAWNDANFMAAMLTYDGEIVTNTATIGVGGLVVNGPVTFNGPFTYISSATTQVTGNTGTFYGDTSGVGALYAGVAGYTPLPATVFQASANVNDYIQNNFQNLNHGTQASTEWVATNDTGDDTNNYIDIGIAGHGWDGTQANSVGTAAGPSDSWVYVQGTTTSNEGGNLVLGTIKNGKSVKILAGSTGSSSIVATFNSTGLTLNTGTLHFADGTVQSTAATSFNTSTLVAQAVSAQTVVGGVGVTSITAGTGTYISTSTGAVTVWTGAASWAGGTVTGTATVATFIGTATATSTSTGAVQVQGGLGVNGNIYANTLYSGDGYFRGPTGNGSILLASGGTVYLTGDLVLNGTTNIKGPAGYTNIQLNSGWNSAVKFLSTATVGSTTDATSSSTGALIVSGGAGIAKNAYVGGYVVQQALPAFRIIGNGGSVSTGTTITNAHWTMDYNQGNYLNTSTGVFTAPVTGIYQINLVMRTNNNVNSTINQAIVIKNTSTTLCMLEFGVNTTMNHAGVSTAARLVAGDTVKVTVAVGTMSFDGNDSWSVAFLG